MKTRVSGGIYQSHQRQPQAGLWLLLCIVGWILVACQSVSSAPTLIPTVALPTPLTTPSPWPTPSPPAPTPLAPGFPTWRHVTLQGGESFDFRQEKTGGPTEGDLYFSAFNASQGTACFWANNAQQIGGRDLGSVPLTALDQRPLPRERFSGQCVPVISRHLYVYGIQGDERLAVFRVADKGLESVTLEYILRR
jgi:hypothetical protein